MSMTGPEKIVDNKTPWVAKQIAKYIETDGAEPVFRYGAPLVLVTTQGVVSGEWRRTCLIGVEHNGDYLLVASHGGAPRHPRWYLNMKANPKVWLQVGGEEFWATARDATPEEKPELWDTMVSVYKDYADYQKKTDREIPVVVLEPVRTD
jgi:deazaflavin-dependent oxidoreductase (nitroreductase family)